MPPKAAVLAIGTELTNGQITNRNSSWLSAEILKLGFETLYHRSVPDERELIQQELIDLSARAEILFVTGGLGPTTDDFTRECIAAFVQKPLVWDEASLVWIQERMSHRQMPFREIQKQQCYYPEGARVLWNNRGTAHGFMLEGPALRGHRTEDLPSRLQKVYVLPGPPSEVEAVFTGGVKPDLLRFYPELDALIVRSWDCLGLGESEIAAKVEAVLVGCPFEKGYRVHLPLVEFKLSYPASRKDEAGPWMEKIEKALGDHLVLRNFETAAGNWAKALNDFRHLEIQDSVTEGEVLRRAVAALAGTNKLSQFSFKSQVTPAHPDKHEILCGARPLGPGHAEFFILSEDLRLGEDVTAPANYQLESMLERQKQFFAESAFLAWTRLLSQLAR